MGKENIIRLTDSELNKLITESVKQVINENEYNNQTQQNGYNTNDLEQIKRFLVDMGNYIQSMNTTIESTNRGVRAIYDYISSRR